MSFVIPSEVDEMLTPTVKYTSDLTKEDIFKEIRKRPYYKWCLFWSKLNIKWKVFRYNQLVKLFHWACGLRYPFDEIKYWKIFNEVWKDYLL